MDNKNLELSVALRHELHAHPDLSEHEEWTKARLMAFLKEHTHLELVDKGKWFYAIYRSGVDKPGIGFRADFDALPMDDMIDKPYRSTIPGQGHKCGHDGHAAGLCGFAMELERVKPQRDVFLVFQHAEENGAGAKECGDFVPETGISEIYAYHNTSGLPENTVKLFRTYYACGSVGMNITMTGIPTHASTPEKGKNPALALSKVVCEIEKIADPKRFDELVLSTIVEVNIGIHQFGIAASSGNVGVTLRAVKEDDMLRIRDEIIAYATKIAQEEGLKVDFSYEDYFPATIGTSAEAEKVARVAESLGFPIYWTPAPSRGSEDFGWFLKQVKGSMFDLSCGYQASLHSVEFDFDDTLIPKANQLFMALVEAE